MHARTIHSDRYLEVDFRETYDPFPEYRESRTFSAPFEISLVTMRVPNDWFILGTTTDGASALMRWIYSPPDGSIVAERPIAGTAIGVPYQLSLIHI